MSLSNWQFCTPSKIFASAAYQVLWECENDVMLNQRWKPWDVINFKLCQIFVNCAKWLNLFFKPSVL